MVYWSIIDVYCIERVAWCTGGLQMLLYLRSWMVYWWIIGVIVLKVLDGVLADYMQMIIVLKELDGVLVDYRCYCIEGVGWFTGRLQTIIVLKELDGSLVDYRCYCIEGVGW